MFTSLFRNWFAKAALPVARSKPLTPEEMGDPVKLMNIEMERLTQPQRKAVKRVIERARHQSGLNSEDMPDEAGQAYAYAGAHGKIHWGFDNPINIARGVVR
ncbi:MAG: hypothetical protein WBX25_13355 [Rhodomicrobium sp.]